MTRKEECAFCDFKDLGVVVYEDYLSYAVITRRPINPYHTLVIPRDHFVDFTDLPDDLAAHIFLTAKNISQAIRSICNPDAISHLSDDDIHRKGYNLMELSTPQAVSPKIAKRVQATGDHRRLDGNFKGILSLEFLPYVSKEGRAEPASLRQVY